MTDDMENMAAPEPRRRGRPRKDRPGAAEEAPAREAAAACGDPAAHANPYGWGAGTTPPGRVRFLRFYSWSSLPLRLVSLRGADGAFLAPGYFACMQATRSAGPVLDALRQQARLTGTPLYIQQIFVPVVYPGVTPFRYWQHCTNPFDQTLVTLHYLHKKTVEDEMRAHFARAIPEGGRFTLNSISSMLLENGGAFHDFFSNPANARCRGIVWRSPVRRLVGSDFPQPQRLVNYAVVRPEWIVDAQPVDGATDLIGSARKDPEACLARVARHLVLDDAALERALMSEKRRQRDIRHRSADDAEAEADAGDLS